VTVADLAASLVAIDSVNSTLVRGGAGETDVAKHVVGWADDHGLEAKVVEATPGRPSVIVTARGRGGGRALLLCGHMDTVGVDGMRDPFTPRREGDRLHGRGSCDMKGGLAAALMAARDAAAAGLAGDVIVACVADEEHASLGVQEIVQQVRHVARLAVDDLPDALDAGLDRPELLEQGDGVADRSERVAKLVGEHGEELILAAIRLAQSCRRRLQFPRPLRDALL